MRITKAIVHPNYVEDGKDLKFTTGADVAFAVAEIPFDKYRALSDEQKVELQASMEGLPEPAPVDLAELAPEKDAVGLVAGYPVATSTARDCTPQEILDYGDLVRIEDKTSEDFLWADYGHVYAGKLDDGVADGATLLCYGEDNLVTSGGQSGSALQLITGPPEAMQAMHNKLNGVVQPIAPKLSKEVLKSHLQNLKARIVGVHVGTKGGRNCATILDELMCLDFAFPALILLHKEFGEFFKGDREI
jgi:hypothetical protein